MESLHKPFPADDHYDLGILPDRICPLCSRVFPQDELYGHIQSEHPHSRSVTIKVIQAYYPAWIEDDGACERCWKSFRKAGQALDLMKGARRPQRSM